MHNELVDIVELTKEQEKEYALSLKKYYTAAVIILNIIIWAYFTYINNSAIGMILALLLGNILQQTNFYTKYIVRGPHIKGTCSSCGNEIIIKKSRKHKRCRGCRNIIEFSREQTAFASDDEYTTRYIENDMLSSTVELTEEEGKEYAADFEVAYLAVILILSVIIGVFIIDFHNPILYFGPLILIGILSSKTFYYKLVARGPYVKGACPICGSEIIIKKSRNHKRCKGCNNTIEYIIDENRFR